MMPINLTINNYNLSLECEVMSDDGFDYEWHRKGKPLPMERIHGVYSPQITINNLKPEDSGKYQCIVSNSTGAIKSQYKEVVITGMCLSFVGNLL